MYQNFLAKDLKDYWNEYKITSENKNTKSENRDFLESSFVWFYRLFFLVYSNQETDSKRFKTWRNYLPKGIIGNL